MKDKIKKVLLYIGVFCAGCVVTALSWRETVVRLEKEKGRLETRLSSTEYQLQNEKRENVDLLIERAAIKRELLKLGIDVEELLN